MRPRPAPCAPGTVAQGGQCVPQDLTCGPGTRPDPSGHCIPDDGLAPTTPWSANQPVVTSNTSDIRAETSVAVDDGGRVFAAFINEPSGGTPPSEIQLAVRAAGASTFADPVTLDLTSLRGGGSFFEGDPTTVIDKQGVFHIAWAEYYSDQSGNVVSDIATTTSADGGKTFSATVKVNTDGGQTFNDRPWITMASDGTLYLNWLSEDATHAYERVATSTDGGKTWQELAPIDMQQGGLIVVMWNGPVVVASPQDILVAGEVYDANSAYIGLTLMASNDGGSTWNEEDLSAPLYASRDISFDPRPQILESPGGTLYYAYVDAPGGHMGVFLVQSTDGGQSFTDPLEVSGDVSAAQTLIWMATDPKNGAHLVWLDNRDGGWRLVYRAIPAGGTTLGPLEAVSDTTFPGSTSATIDPYTWLGDYLGFVIRGGHAYATWTDTRDGQSDIYFSEATLP